MKYNGILIYNNCLISDKYTSVYNLYLEASKQLNINLKLISNTEIYNLIDNNTNIIFNNINYNIDFILFLDKDIYLAKLLELKDYKVYNNSESIRICDDKVLTYISLCNNDICMPKTIIGSKYYSNYKIDNTNIKYIEYIEDTLKYPLIIKEAKGSFGKQVYLINNREELTNKMQELVGIDCLYQELIKTSYGKDIRIQVAFNKVVTSVKRISDNDFRSNVSNGGYMLNYKPDKEYIDMALKVCNILNLDFAGIDILFGENNKPILCEVNSNALINNLYKTTNINSAINILQGIIDTL